MKTTRITVETETLTVVRRAKVVSTWCPQCCAERETITLDAESLADTRNAVEIERWKSTGKLHFWDAGDASRLCVKSLFQCFGCKDVLGLADLGGNRMA